MAVVAVLMALAYALTNGLHDAANSIAALVATGAARPAQAIVLATIGNVLGPLLLGAAVADTIAGIVTVAPSDVIAVVGAGLTGAVVWNFFTWSRGLPSSSGHALVGGLVGAALADAGVHAVNWGGLDGIHPVGVIGSLIALAIAPIAGFVAGFVLDRMLLRSLGRATDRVKPGVRSGQWVMSGLLAFGHGANDASKSVGVVAVVLLADGSIGSLQRADVDQGRLLAVADARDGARWMADRPDYRPAHLPSEAARRPRARDRFVARPHRVERGGRAGQHDPGRVDCSRRRRSRTPPLASHPVAGRPRDRCHVAHYAPDLRDPRSAGARSLEVADWKCLKCLSGKWLTGGG